MKVRSESEDFIERRLRTEKPSLEINGEALVRNIKRISFEDPTERKWASPETLQRSVVLKLPGTMTADLMTYSVRDSK